MTGTAPTIWFLFGLLLGGLHAASIRRSSQRASALLAVEGLLRLLAVGVVLYFAAVNGHPLAAACGWGIGMLQTGLVLLLGGRTT